MPTRSEVTFFRTPYANTQKVKTLLSAGWQTSPRVNGRLRLVSLPLEWDSQENLSYDEQYGGLWEPPGVRSVLTATGVPEAGSAYLTAYNKAYGSFRGKLHNGGASLGITIVQYKQSADMVRDRSRKLLSEASTLMNRFTAGLPRNAASIYLEALFGWIPLVTDMYSSAFTVIQQADRLTALTGRGRAAFRHHDEADDTYYSHLLAVDGQTRVTVSSLVRVTNPNLWLLNRAGLINPAAVAWDAVPMSFIVNWFANVNSLVNSVTDFVGLAFDNQSVTTTVETSGYEFQQIHIPGYPASSASSSWKSKRKTRSVGSIPRPSLEFRLPGVDWGGAAIASSLAIQKVGSLSSLVSKTLNPSK